VPDERSEADGGSSVDSWVPGSNDAVFFGGLMPSWAHGLPWSRVTIGEDHVQLRRPFVTPLVLDDSWKGKVRWTELSFGRGSQIRLLRSGLPAWAYEFTTGSARKFRDALAKLGWLATNDRSEG